MCDIISREVTSSDLKDVVSKLIPDAMALDIQKSCQGIYPLHDVHIRKVKVLRKPRQVFLLFQFILMYPLAYKFDCSARFDAAKLLELHGEGSGKAAATTDPTTGEVVERPEGYEPPVLEAV
jgi:small subunit ribosomal protein S3Ae